MEASADSLSSCFVAALIENRAKEVGLAAFDLRSASLHLSQFIETSRSYQNTMTLLHFFDPTDIIITPPNPGMFGVSSAIEHCLGLQSRKVVWPRRCFDDTKGALTVKNLAIKEPPELGLDSYYKQYYLCLGAAAAVIKWIENEKGMTVTYHSIQVNFNGSVNHMSIDATSVQNLEVIEALMPVHGKITRKCNSLFSLMNTTRTIGGISFLENDRARLLRANLLQPLKDIQTINTRLDCLDELMSNEKLFFGLSQALLKFPKDIDRVLSHFCFKQRKNVAGGSTVGTAGARRSQALVAGVILLKEAIEALPFLSEVLKDAKSYLLCNISKSVCEHPGFKVLKKSIEEVIDDDVLHARAPFVARTQQCFAVKSGMNGLLDVARRTFCDTSEAIHALAKKYREEMGLPNLKMPFNSRRGFYITIPEKDVDKKLPHVLTQVMKQGKNIQCSTQELTSLNVRNKEAAEECYLQTELCLEGLYDKIREEIWVLSLLSESLCLLDMIVNAFANMISTKQVDSYTRPEFTESGPIAIELGRHPVIECIHGGDFVANNTFLSEASNMAIVTGPNMSGKSTYLRQVALVTILAHIGCYVPAKFASFRIVDCLFTRIGTRDSLESNSSTFMTEMKETAYFIQNITPRSLVIIDELGRATSSLDGLAIAWSCCEYLLSLRAYTIFATHMDRLIELASIYPNVKVYHFQVSITNNRLDFKYSVKEGHTNISHYGLLLAEVAGFPPELIQTSKTLAEKLIKKEIQRIEKGCSVNFGLRKDYHVAQRLLCLRYANLSEDNLRGYLQNLKDTYSK